MEPRDHLFTIWLTKKDWDAMPFLEEICIASAQVVNNKPVTIYTNNELHLAFLDRTITKVEKIPQELLDHVAKITDNLAHQSDYLRLWYLNKFGGIYFDADVLFWKPFTELWDTMVQEGYSVLYPREDKNMICNCMIMCSDPVEADRFFSDMLCNYDDRYIGHSYLFNSQKYMNLMMRRYPKELCIYWLPSLFEGKWNDYDSVKDFQDMKTSGIGQHLYWSIKELWGNVRLQMDAHVYDVEPTLEIHKYTKSVIDKYIQLMKEADNNGK